MNIFKKIFQTKTFKKKPVHILIIDKLGNTKYDLAEYDIKRVIYYNSHEKMKEDGYPDLIILCDNVQRFYLNNPLLLYKAEIYFSRNPFSKNTFEKALQHFSDCEIRNGK